MNVSHPVLHNAGKSRTVNIQTDSVWGNENAANGTAERKKKKLQAADFQAPLEKVWSFNWVIPLNLTYSICKDFSHWCLWPHWFTWSAQPAFRLPHEREKKRPGGGSVTCTHDAQTRTSPHIRVKSNAETEAREALRRSQHYQEISENKTGGSTRSF